MIMKNKKIPAIEGLRGLMAWWVVFFHGSAIVGVGHGLLAGTPKFINHILGMGDVAVNVFIVISGFVIAHLVIEKAEPYRVYIVRRFLRIFPIYIVCLLIAIFVAPLYRHMYFDINFGNTVDYSDRILRDTLVVNSFWIYFSTHITMLHGMIPEQLLKFSSTAFLGPAWSLSLEWQFYLMAPVVIVTLAKPSLLRFVLLAFLLIARFALERQGTFTWSASSFFFTCSNYFVVGIYSRFLITKLRRLDQPSNLVDAAILLLFLATCDLKVLMIWGCFYSIISIEENFPSMSGNWFLRAFKAIFENRFVVTMGTWSYSAYLVHIPIFSVVIGGSIATFEVVRTSQSMVFLLGLVSLPVVAASSLLLYNAVERPFIQLGSRLGGKLLSATRP